MKEMKLTIRMKEIENGHNGQTYSKGRVKKKRLKRVTLYIFGFKPTLPSQLVT